jgi:uncharacterized repeat protein (TIGR03803 family)
MRVQRIVQLAVVFALVAAAGRKAAAQEKLLYSFGAASKDGSGPNASLISDSNGNFYGTTEAGGSHGAGTVFELSPAANETWTENVLYNFGAAASDGEAPQGSLLMDSLGNLYGTTSSGGTYGDGTVFELVHKADGAWTEKTLHEFAYSAGKTDGSTPMGGLIFDYAGNLVGTTASGGTGNGTVFQLKKESDESWTEQVLYSFTYDPSASPADGSQPQGNLVIDKKGNLYGTTLYGGNAPAIAFDNGAGTIFELSPTANGGYEESALYEFSSSDPQLIPYEGADGAYPAPNLVIDAQGNLYGIANAIFSYETFQADPTGVAFEVLADQVANGDLFLYEFGSYPTDAVSPLSPPIRDAKGNLYGISGLGGSLNQGIVYKLSPSQNEWSETVLYNFGSIEHDGSIPLSFVTAGLERDAAGNLYGTTSDGGKYGQGTVFEIPAAPMPLPQFSPAAGSYRVTQYIKISDTVPDATIYYTTDGKTPTTASKTYTEPVEVSSSGTLKAMAVGPGEWQSAVATATYLIGNPTTTPRFSLSSGTYDKVQAVAITDAMPDAAIYFTIDGTTPTTSSTKYSRPIEVSQPETIRAIAKASGYLNSGVASVTIDFPPAAKPLLSLATGTYDTIQTLRITDSTSHATIYYTTNGDRPTGSSSKYEGPISISASETVKAIAAAPLHDESAIASATYTVDLPSTAQPVFSVAPGDYTLVQFVKISDGTVNASIYYTTDGSTPTPASTPYTGPIGVPSSQTLKAMAIAPDHSVSPIAIAKYVVNLPAASENLIYSF